MSFSGTERSPPGLDRNRDADHSPSFPPHPSNPPPVPPLPLSLDRPATTTASAGGITPLPTLPESPMAAVTPTVERRPSVGLRGNGSAGLANGQPTIRAVTPEPQMSPLDDDGSSTVTGSRFTRPFGSMSPRSSPRAIPGASTLSHHGSNSSRRQGVVFADNIAGSFDSASSSPPPRGGSSSYRPRTHTMDGTSPFRDAIVSTFTPSASSGQRKRVGSFSSTATAEANPRSVPLQGPSIESLASTYHQEVVTGRVSEAQVTSATAFGSLSGSASAANVASAVPSNPTTAAVAAPSTREKKGSTRRLIKRTSSRPTSPLISPPPSVDSLSVPIPTTEANKVLMLMKTLCGRMRGEIEYQGTLGDPWSKGVCYIEEEKGSLMFDAGDDGPFHIPVIPDLRGCRISPAERPDRSGQCLEIVNAQSTAELVLRPLMPVEFELWLAALLCWQQLRPAPGVASVATKSVSARNVSTPSTGTNEPGKKRGPAVKAKDGAIIKVGKVMLWDKGVATSPRAIVKRPSTRDLKSLQTSWRRVSCILNGNGEFKLMTENDVTILSIIELSQLARCAIQQLDKSVLDEEYCIAIFPIYASTSTKLSIFRPVYIALDSRVAFEVWFVLLRAFAIPDIYALDANGTKVYGVAEMNAQREKELAKGGEASASQQNQLFRLDKSLVLRITEAKIKQRPAEANQGGLQDRSLDRIHERQGKNDHHDPLVGNYLAEVILDGEVRARTTTKTDTKNPFWREDCEFVDLPGSLPFLSVILKRVEGNLDSFTHQLQASLGLPKTGNLREIMSGAVDIPLNNLEPGTDHEQWLSICDDRQQIVGSMLVKVHHEELVVLALEEYKPILALLHRFGSGLTQQIAQIMPSNLRRLADVFLNIFQVSGGASDWLMALVEDEIDGIGNQTAMKKMRFSKRLKSGDSIDSAGERGLTVRDMGKSLQGEANLLFRGNTLLTQSLEFHMRRLGKEYLEEVLSDKIFEINEINPDCEVDPSKIRPGDDIGKHWDQLMSITTEIWDCITASASRFPTELRQILKYIRAVAEDRYGDFLRTVTYTSVSGFLFLRFVCPAILNPKLFGLLRDHPRPRAQRTLTLIAKGLQALANLSTIGTKETWMEPMNRFLTANRQSVKDFIDSICSISSDKANTPTILPASYSTPTAIMGRLSPAAREGFPSLPYLIDQPRNVAALVNLWMDAHPLTAPESHLYDGELLEFNNACAKLRDKSDACIASLQAHQRALENGGGHRESDETLADAMEKASLAESINLSYGAPPKWMDNGDGGNGSGIAPPGSSGSDADERWGRSRKNGRRPSLSNGQGGENGNSAKARNGMQARKFFSGIISRRMRTTSPDTMATGSNPASRGRDLDREKSHERLAADRDQDRDRSISKALDGNATVKDRSTKDKNTREKSSKDKSSKDKASKSRGTGSERSSDLAATDGTTKQDKA